MTNIYTRSPYVPGRARGYPPPTVQVRRIEVEPSWKFKVLVFLAGCLIGAIASFFIGCSTAPTNKIIVQPDTVSMLPVAWVISYSPNMPTHPTASGNGWSFDFPTKDGVHYIEVPYHANKPHSTLSITYRVTGTGKFVPVDPCAPNEAGNFRPILERTGDALSASQEFYRFWGAPVTLVADGQSHTVTWALTYTGWTGVYGKSNQTEFATTMQNLMGVGITFGSCYAGHGVFNSGGKAKFELLNYAIK